jgi:release factor glutamine methyltransferase
VVTIREAVEEGRRRLSGEGIESPGREARLLLGSILGAGEARLLAGDDEAVEAGLFARFRALLDRRARGEPAAYLLGRREFYGRDFVVDERVLIPRPETEHLVEVALGFDLPTAARVVDVGTGSGAIALTLAAERPSWRVVATDLSLGALACARANRDRLGLAAQVGLARADLDAALALDAFDLVVSNPPYVDPLDESLVEAGVRTWEPHLALFAAERGLAVIARLLDAAARLEPGARLAFEIGFGQRDAVLDLARRRGFLELETVVDDAAGTPRDVVFKRRHAA